MSFNPPNVYGNSPFITCQRKERKKKNRYYSGRILEPARYGQTMSTVGDVLVVALNYSTAVSLLDSYVTTNFPASYRFLVGEQMGTTNKTEGIYERDWTLIY